MVPSVVFLLQDYLFSVAMKLLHSEQAQRARVGPAQIDDEPDDSSKHTLTADDTKKTQWIRPSADEPPKTKQDEAAEPEAEPAEEDGKLNMTANSTGYFIYVAHTSFTKRKHGVLALCWALLALAFNLALVILLLCVGISMVWKPCVMADDCSLGLVCNTGGTAPYCEDCHEMLHDAPFPSTSIWYEEGTTPSQTWDEYFAVFDRNAQIVELELEYNVRLPAGTTRTPDTGFNVEPGETWEEYTQRTLFQNETFSLHEYCFHTIRSARSDGLPIRWPGCAHVQLTMAKISSLDILVLVMAVFLVCSSVRFPARTVRWCCANDL